MVELKPVPGTSNYLWKYLPSIPLSAVSLGLFAFTSVGLLLTMYRSKGWFGTAFLFGGIFQILGFGIRIVCYWNTDSVALYAVQSSLIVLAPVLYAASIYMALGRLISSLEGDKYSLVRPRRLSRLFIWSDVIALNLQGNGSGLAVSQTRALALAGQVICVVGLVFQLIMLLLFLSTAAMFHSKMNQRDKPRAGRPCRNSSEHEGLADQPMASDHWKKGLHTLYACSVLIIIRSIFRAVEYAMGTESYLLTREWPMYALDTSLMVLCQVIFWLRFPGEFTYRAISEDDPEYKLQEWKNEKGMKKLIMASRASLPW